MCTLRLREYVYIYIYAHWDYVCVYIFTYMRDYVCVYIFAYMHTESVCDLENEFVQIEKIQIQTKPQEWANPDIDKRRVWKGGFPHLETKAEIMGVVVKFIWGISDLFPKYLGGLFCS